MSDFSELCPLFNTGVFNEVTFSNINMSMTAVSATAVAYNLLLGSLSIAHSNVTTAFTFGRTVIVTKAFMKRGGTAAALKQLWLGHHTTVGAAPTVFGTFTMTTSVVQMGGWKEFGDLTAKTFTSDEVLGLAYATFTAEATCIGSMHGFDMIIRYKEK